MSSRTKKIMELLQDENQNSSKENNKIENILLNTSISFSSLILNTSINNYVEEDAFRCSELIAELEVNENNILVLPIQLPGVNDESSIYTQKYVETNNSEMEVESNKEYETDDPSFVIATATNSNNKINTSEEHHPGHSNRKIKRHRKRRSDENTWDYNQNKYKRMKGLNYNGRGKSEDGKAVFNNPRPPRKMLPHCNCKHSYKGKALKCREFSDENRQEIFNHFWEKLNWPERKQYVRGLVDVLPTVKKTAKDTSRRDSTFVLKLKLNGVSHRVCKKLFLNTFGIGEWSLRNWTKLSLNESSNNEASHQKRNPKSAEANKILDSFFNNLPKMESHYCRSRSKKLYLESIWQSKADLFEEYQKFSKLENSAIKPVSILNQYQY